MQRLHTETAFEVLARAETLRGEGKSVINLGIGQPDFNTPQHVVEAAVRALHDGHHGYTPAPGILPLREAVANDILKYRNISVHPDEILVVPGGKVVLFFAILMFGESGAEILYPNPSFPIYQSVIEFSGARAVPIPLLEENKFAFSADDVLNLITENTRLIIVNSPANPTGGTVPKSEIDKLVAGLQEFPHVAILSDEIYSRICYDQEHTTLLAYPEIRDRLILLDGWSKTYAMTGWRLGYSVWPQELIEPAQRLAINCHSCVNTPAQFGAIAALEGPQDFVAEMNQAFLVRRDYLVKALNSIESVSCTLPTGAFYAFPNISQLGRSAEQIQNELLNNYYVATVAGTSFGLHGEGYLRFSYAASLDDLKVAVERLHEYCSKVALRTHN
ncbi:MAG: pyridoxal phosphate-dependent aminotransferase [Gammaproteobacteria bacterium]|nr:pyridoxal phosphate-dependent aminotransferase [Gammaproteobacteria bacterium]MYC25849.1 pyridoxal phosphate-dependent aminotransferase [Gammaproteobacteria bacterium]